MKAVHGVMLTVLVIGTLTFTLNIQFVKGSKPLAPNGVHDLSTYESRIGEQGILFEDDNLQMWVPESYENHATTIFNYLVAGYANLSSIFGDHEYPYKFSIEHYPKGSPYFWGGTDARGTIRYGYSNLEDNTPEWNLYEVPHMIGYYEEMAHCFVYDFGVRGEVSVGFYETLGMMIGGETTLRAAHNPYIETLIANNYQTFSATTSYYLEHDDGPPGVPENIWLTRVLAHIFKTEVVDTYGWDTLTGIFEALQDGYPLREYDRDHTWGGFLCYLGKLTSTDFHAVFGNYGLPIMTWTGEKGYKSDGVESTGNNRYLFKVKCFDREGVQPTKGQLHLYTDGSISDSPHVMSFIGGDDETGWMYAIEVEIEVPLFKYAFSADDGAHSIFQAVGKPTVKHALHESLPVHNIDTGEDFASIQEAINAPDTLDGHTILVDEGTYYENVWIHKSITLVGENRSATTVDGNQTGTVIYVNSGSSHLANVTVSGFTIQNSGNASFDCGIRLRDVSHSNITQNMITNNSVGIHLDMSHNNTVSANTVTYNEMGVKLYTSSNNTMRSNDMSDNHFNFGVRASGRSLSLYINDVDISNTVDGKPIYYWINKHDAAVPLDAGYVALVNCTNITVQSLTLTNNWQGALFAFSTNSTITKNNIANNWDGVRLKDSSNNTISKNEMTKNIVGAWLGYSSSMNVVVGNDITNNGGDPMVELIERGGILLYWASNHVICQNNIANNMRGIELIYACDNLIYHNNLIDNIPQVYWPYSYTSMHNMWDNSYPSGGNYWSDYKERYPNATEIDVSGVWDTPYVMDDKNQDNYPLAQPWSPEPPNSIEALEELTEIIESWNLDKGIERSLTSKLLAAHQSLDKKNQKSAVGQLGALVNHVEALKDKKLTFQQANQLISEATRIIDLIKK